MTNSPGDVIAAQGTLRGTVVLGPLLALTLALGASPRCPDASLQLGAADASTQIEAHLDPTSSGALGTVLELRRLVGERPGELGVRVRWTHLGVRLDPRADRVRAWIAAMAAAGHALEALRIVRRDGVDRTFVRLGTAHGRATLAEAFDLDPGHLDQLAAQDCHELQMEQDRREVAQRMSDRGTAVFRLPVFVVDDLTFEDSGLLDRVRPVLARRRARARAAQERPSPGTPPPKSASPRLVRPKVRSHALGGPGLPHAFVLLARGEDDPALFTLLPPVLAHRRVRPGDVSVTVVARGLGLDNGLRQRLCKAHAGGLLPAYLHLLSADPSSRAADPATQVVLEAIDSVTADPPCDLDPDEDEEALPDGGWLDGVPVTRSDLEVLGAVLRRLEAARRPLDAFLAPASDDL
ncbi:MAG: hypothetical protein ACE37F_26780 [Nannocystaceae bacterium]|nr:hypothetical protein [bacterium]